MAASASPKSDVHSFVVMKTFSRGTPEAETPRPTPSSLP